MKKKIKKKYFDKLSKVFKSNQIIKITDEVFLYYVTGINSKIDRKAAKINALTFSKKLKKNRSFIKKVNLNIKIIKHQN